MKTAASDSVISHWHHPVRDFRASTQDFYRTVEAALLPCEIPDLVLSRVEYKQGGLLSAKREYLRVQRETLVYDICAAPFGTGYFFSSWLTKQPVKFGFLRLLAVIVGVWIVFGILAAIFRHLFGLFVGAVIGAPFAVIGVFVLLWFLGTAVRNGTFGSGAEDLVIDTPVVGWFYVKLFAPATYYKLDATLAFQSMVHGVVTEAVSALLDASGRKPLTEFEEKPVLHGFLSRSAHAGG